MRRLILADSELKSGTGHYFRYAASVKAEAERAGIPFSALAHMQCDPSILCATNGIPSFRQGVHEWFSPNPYPPEWPDLFYSFDMLGSNASFLSDLREHLRTVASPGDLVFVPNATERHLLGVAAFLWNTPRELSPDFALLLRYSLLEPSVPDASGKREFETNPFKFDSYGKGFERVAHFIESGRVRLLTDSHRLADEYRELFSVPVEVVPIPHAESTAGTSPAPGPEIPPKDPSRIRVVFLGDTRLEKGVHLLPPLAGIMRKLPTGNRIELVFQAFIGSPYHEPLRPCLDALADMESPGLKLLSDPLSEDGYRALIGSADLVLLPYDPMVYSSRTSGPFVEAACMGVPVVTTAGSWMHDQLLHVPAGECPGEVFDYEMPAEFIKSVFLAVNGIDRLKTAARAFAEPYRQFHNPERFLRSLMNRPESQ